MRLLTAFKRRPHLRTPAQFATIIAFPIMLALLAAAQPAPADARPIRLLAIGDYGMGGPTQARYGGAVQSFSRAHEPALLLTLGDNDYSKATAFEKNWRASFGWLATEGIPVAGALGNHDIEAGDGSHVFRSLGMPGPYYKQTVGSADIFVLNSNDVSTIQTAWLRRSLERSDARWKIATMHHPAHSCGGHASEESVQERWVPLFEEFGVQLVLAGHDHNYQRFAARNGVNYVIHGGGGRPAHELRTCEPAAPELVSGRVVVGFLSIVARKNGLVVKAINLRGRQIDRLVIRP